MEAPGDTAPKQTPSPGSYFTGSDRIEDYFIDLDVDPARQPIDIQAYLECIGIELRRQDDPENPEWNGQRARSGHDSYAPYVPRLDVVAEGLTALRKVSQTREHGLWLDPSDVTPEDMASSTCAHNPWLETLSRTNRMEAAVDACKVYRDEPWGYYAVVYGNVRIALPTELCGPQSGRWLAGASAIYGRDHPVTLLAGEPDEDQYDDGYDDGFDNNDDQPDGNKPEPEHVGLMEKMRFSLSAAGVRHTTEPVLPLTPYLQDLFDGDPEAFHEMICKTAEDDAPMYHPPVGYPEWLEKYSEENARVNPMFTG